MIHRAPILLLAVLAGCVPTTDDATPTSAANPTATPATPTPSAHPTRSPTPTATPRPSMTPPPTAPPTVTAPPDETESPTLAPTAAPTPLPLIDGGALEASREALTAGDATFALPTDDHGLLFAQGGILWWRGPLDDDVTNLGPVAPIYGGAWVDDGTALLSTADGLKILNNGLLQTSPLEAVVGDGPSQLLAAPGDDNADLWIASDTGLYRWRQGALSEITPGALPTRGANLSWGKRGEEDALWVAAEGQVFALVGGDGHLEAWPEAVELDVSALASPGGGALWALSPDGALNRRDGEGRWRSVSLEMPVDALGAHSDAHTLWLTMGGQLWRVNDGALEQAGRAATLLAADAQGRALITEGGQLTRVAEGRPLYLYGLRAGQTVDEATSLYLLPTLADQVAGLQAWLGEVPAEIAADPPHIPLDPFYLEPGFLTVTAQVTYDDDRLSETQLTLAIGDFIPPTWSADILPIYEVSCEQCHNASGFAHPLYSSTLWQSEIDGIINSVSAGDMPLTGPKLTDGQIEAIVGWKLAGFPESL